MYIRKTKTRQLNNKDYFSYRLVESIRCPNGKVKQQTLLNLGSDYSIVQEADWSLLTDRIKNIVTGQQCLFPLTETLETEAQRLATLIIKRHGVAAMPDAKTSAPNYEYIDLNTIANSDIKSIGVEYLAYETAKKINLPEILSSCGFTQKDIDTALASIIGRLVSPGSEVATSQCLRNNSALDEILGTDFSMMHKNRLYDISDLLLKHKEIIESKLYDNEKGLFGFTEIVTLYDLTNTYFEGESGGNDNAAFGRSKEKRSDCVLVTLALVLDGSGFPKKSHIFKGNCSEATTLEQMLKKLSDKKAMVIMDAGIATEDNIKWLSDNKYNYLVVSRKRSMSLPDIEGVIVKEDPQNKVTTFLVKNEDTKEHQLYCHSEGMEKRENFMAQKYITRFEGELTKLSQGLSKKRGVKKYDKIHQKLGRLKEQYSTIARQFDIEVTADDNKEKALEIKWIHKPENKIKAPGIYCLRTNQTELSNKEIWDTYRMLNDIEAAFRILKTDLGLRPIYHQKTDRVSGHIFITLLAYHILHAIRYQLMKHGINDSWSTISHKLSNHYRVTTSVQRQSGKVVHIRKTMHANPEQLQIYRACKLSSPPIQNTITQY